MTCSSSPRESSKATPDCGRSCLRSALKWALPIVFYRPTGILPRLGVIAEVCEVRVDRSVEFDFSTANLALQSDELAFLAQMFERLVRVEHQRRPPESARRAAGVRMHADDEECLAGEA